MMDFLNSFVNLVPVTLAQSLLYGFVALGIMIPFRLLSFPDLTCEGAFPLGGCLCAALLVAGVAPVLAMLIAVTGRHSCPAAPPPSSICASRSTRCSPAS